MATNFTNDANMVAYYMFESDPGVSKSGTGDNHVDDAGNLPVEDTADFKQGLQSAQFVTNDYMRCDDPTADFPGRLDTSFTVLMWVKITAASDGFCHFREDTTENHVWRFMVQADRKLYMSINHSDGTPAEVSDTADTALDTGVWYHIALVYDKVANLIYMYLNGNLDNAPGFGFDHDLQTYAATYFDIGVAYGNYLDGRIDEMAIFSRVLSGAEITEIMNDGLAGTVSDWTTHTHSTIVFS